MEASILSTVTVAYARSGQKAAFWKASVSSEEELYKKTDLLFLELLHYKVESLLENRAEAFPINVYLQPFSFLIELIYQ